MIVVAVSQRVDEFSDREETRDALDQRLISFLIEAGLIPVPIPNVLFKALPRGQTDTDVLDDWLAAIKPKAFVLSGGNDIQQFRQRDLTETMLLNHASKLKIPLLGICRGMQIMADWAGVDLHHVQRHVRTRHRLTGEVCGEVNSYHNFSLANCPAEFKVLARSEDGEIEAIRHQTLAWEGWMWHPEREENFAMRDLQRVKDLFCG
jgi:gamma-glutamyl-gamma-aminobutyrate hydrolase PuuD